MAGTALLGVAASLSACGGQQQGGGERDASLQSSASYSAASGKAGRILDLAEVLTAEEEQKLGARLQRLSRDGPGPLLIVFLRPEPGDSLERIGWAAGGGQKGVPLLVLVDPDGAQVRIEGELTPEERAVVASAMREQLRLSRPAEAVLAGLDRLEQLGR